MLGREAVEIKSVLDRSAAAWSAGDLDAFMTCYQDSPETVYITATRIVSGYQAIRRMYAERLAGPAGTLTMTLIRVMPLEATHVAVVGRYSLQRAATLERQSAGQFLLVFHKTAAGWHIIADHTS
jgi:uncharacterized protein (TIGR02246 family)